MARAAPASETTHSGSWPRRWHGHFEMKRVGLPRKSPKFATGLALSLCCALLCLLPSAERDARASNRIVLAVVVARNSSVQDLSLSALRRIFTNEGDTD